MIDARLQWQAANEAAILRRLEPLRRLGDGLLQRFCEDTERGILVKDGAQVQLYFIDRASSIANPVYSGIMSRVDLDDPLNLLGTYTQAMTLALVWNPHPRRIHIMGFGGGRIAQVLHHHLPEVIIDGSELNGYVLELAQQFFGVTLDHRLQVHVGDGRALLERRHDAAGYDMIMVDCFIGAGDHPDRLQIADHTDGLPLLEEVPRVRRHPRDNAADRAVQARVPQPDAGGLQLRLRKLALRAGGLGPLVLNAHGIQVPICEFPGGFGLVHPLPHGVQFGLPGLAKRECDVHSCAGAQ